MTINDRIKSIRVNSGIKQGIVASALGMSSSRLSAIESGVQNPTIQQIEAISRYFGVSTDYLIFGVDTKVTPVERELLGLIRDDAGLFKSLTDILNAKKNVLNSFMV
jgi:transcriptional regulator with XRE-family HTH domain